MRAVRLIFGAKLRRHWRSSLVFSLLITVASERHGGQTPAGVTVRILQRILALTTAIWHNDHTGTSVHRSLTAYDH